MCQKLRGICCGASGTWTESTLNNRGKESYRQIKTPPTYLQYLTPFCTLPPSDAYFSALYKTIQLGHFWQIAWSYLWKNNLSLGWNVPERGGGDKVLTWVSLLMQYSCLVDQSFGIVPHTYMHCITIQSLVTKFSGLVVMGRDSRSKGHGFESWHRILDGHFSHIIVVKIVLFVWKDRK